jgi:hypothetical protein
MLELALFILMVLCFGIWFFPCEILGHYFDNAGKYDICRQCGLVRKKVKK